jgi:hypothetical protein
MASHAAAYVRPWVVAPGERVALHASLPAATQVDVVRIRCANAERAADGSPHGPPERIEVVAAGPGETLGPALQPLQPGAQVRAACAHWPAWPELALVLAVQRQPRGQGGTVLSLHDDAGRGLRIDLRVESPTQAWLCIGFDRSQPELEWPCPGADWLLLALAVEGPALRVRTAVCRASVPDGVPGAWQEQRLNLSAVPTGAPRCLHLGTRPGEGTAADLRLDLVSVLPRAACEALSPRDLLARDLDALSPWQPSIDVVQRPYTAVRGVRWDGRWHDPQAAPAHYSARHFNSDTLLDAQWSADLGLAGAGRPAQRRLRLPAARRHRRRAGVRQLLRQCSKAAARAPWQCVADLQLPGLLQRGGGHARPGGDGRAACRRGTAGRPAPGARPIALRTPPRRTRRVVGRQPAPAVERVARPPAVAVRGRQLAARLAGPPGPGLRRDHRPRRAPARRRGAGALPGGDHRPPPGVHQHGDVGRPVAYLVAAAACCTWAATASTGAPRSTTRPT